jgi:hypothetical protein
MTNKDETRERLLDLAVSVIKLGDPGPKTAEGRKVIAHLMRSAAAAAIAYCRAELALAQLEPADDLGRVIEPLDEAESLVENLVRQKLVGKEPAALMEQTSKELQELLGAKVRFAMWELCGQGGRQLRNTNLHNGEWGTNK